MSTYRLDNALRFLRNLNHVETEKALSKSFRFVVT